MQGAGPRMRKTQAVLAEKLVVLAANETDQRYQNFQALPFARYLQD